MGYNGKTTPTILVPTDFSTCSEKAVRRAIELARSLEGTVVLLHVVDTTPLYVAPEAPIVWSQYVDQIREDAESRVRALANELGIARFEVVEGRPAFAVLECAERIAPDLIVMGTHGRRGFSRFFLGSVAERVFRTAPCDVLVVRAKDDGPSAAAGA